jgi:F-type H+-transporting ATPase subunit delta
MTTTAQKTTDPTAANDVSIDKQRLGSIYAKAILGASEARSNSDAMVEELDALVDQVLKPFPDFEAALASPRISFAEKSGLLDRVFAGRISDQLLTFLKVVGQHGRLDCIRDIRRAAHDELNRLRQRISVRVTTAEPLSNPLQERIRQQLQAKLGREIELHCTVDSDLIGGLMVRVGDTVYDGSVANQLARLKQDAINKTILQFREATDRFTVSS